MQYITIDNQGGGWRDYTHTDPETRKQIIDRFYSMGCNEGFETLKKHYTLNFIQDLWEISFYYIKKGNTETAVNMYDKKDILKWDWDYRQFI